MGLHSRLRTCLLVSSALLALTGCGGGGALSGHTVSLSASKVSLQYGEPVTISWVTRDTDTSHQNGILACNFADATAPLATVGSIVDHPAVTSTYTMTVAKPDGSTASDEVTVSVAKGAGKFLVVGDTASAESTTAQTLLTQITTVTPVLSATLPNPSATYDAVVITVGGSIGVSDKPRVLAWLAAGKGVIVVGEAAKKLATGDLSNQNLSSISGWFGGVTSCSGLQSNLYATFVGADANIGVAATNHARVGHWTAATEINSVGAATVPQSSGHNFNAPIVTSWSFVSGAGRVYFIAGLVGESVVPDDHLANLSEFFLPGARWASRS